MESLCSYRIDFALIFAYTYRGGLKPSSLILTNIFLSHFCLYDYLFYFAKAKSLLEAFEAVKNSNYSKIFSSTISYLVSFTL
jgi:hypothetical protein